MPNKKNISEEPNANLNELDQLRQIVFGKARDELVIQLATLRTDMDRNFAENTKAFTDSLNEMRQDFSAQFTDITNKLLFIDKTHDDNEASLQKDLNALTSEYETFAATTEQDFKNAEQSLVNESSTLESKFSQQLEQLQSHLEDVSKELSSSKTDRKTLARLLATMATNLEDDLA